MKIISIITLLLLVCSCVGISEDNRTGSVTAQNVTLDQAIQSSAQTIETLPQSAAPEFPQAVFDIFDTLHNANPFYGPVYQWGNRNYPVMSKGSVTAVLFEELDINTAHMVPMDPAKAMYAGQVADSRQRLLEIERERIIRTGMIKPEIKYIVYHETGSGDAGSDALYMMQQWMPGRRNDRARSWHYTVDSSGVFQSLPDDEVAWHGDCFESYSLSIGIETCINRDSDFFLTWQWTAKLIAYLLDKYNLAPDAVLQHYEIMVITGTVEAFEAEGKKILPCPYTLRHPNYNYWEMAKRMIDCEYSYLQEVVKKGYRVELIPDSPEYIGSNGRIIRIPPGGRTEAGYTIRVTDRYNNIYEKRYVSVLGG